MKSEVKLQKASGMFACVVMNYGVTPPREMYSSFHATAEKAIAYAEPMRGVIRVEKAHAGEPAIWTRESVE